MSVLSAFFFFFLVWESIFICNRVIGCWGSAVVSVNLFTVPIAHHVYWFDRPAR